jgi:hypothetical protein
MKQIQPVLDLYPRHLEEQEYRINHRYAGKGLLAKIQNVLHDYPDVTVPLSDLGSYTDGPSYAAVSIYVIIPPASSGQYSCMNSFKPAHTHCPVLSMIAFAANAAVDHAI